MAPKSGGVAWLLLLLTTASPSAAWLWVATSHHTVSVCRGQDALLRCLFSTASPPPFDLDLLRVHWRLGSKDVVSFENVMTVQRPGAELSIDELRKGNASLALAAVEHLDSGRYVCQVVHSGEVNQASVRLKLGATRNNWYCDYRGARIHA